MPSTNHTTLYLDYADRNVTWDAFFPEWIDEEQDVMVPSCPSLPRLEVPRRRLDLIAVKLPCRNEGNWSRDVARLHLQVSAAGLAAMCKGSYPVHLLFVTRCFPMPNLFPCKDLVAHRGDAWLYRPQLSSLRAKLQLPIGSCELALPLGSIGRYNHQVSNNIYLFFCTFHLTFDTVKLQYNVLKFLTNFNTRSLKVHSYLRSSTPLLCVMSRLSFFCLIFFIQFLIL